MNKIVFGALVVMVALLGLFIVAEIARAHGGSVAVRSGAAEGTTFTVTLPRSVPR